MRALRRPQQRRFVTSIMRTARKVELRTPGGLYVGNGTTYNVDVARLDAVIRRTMLGLYFHEMGKRIPEGHEPRVLCVGAFDDLPAQQLQNLGNIAQIAGAGRRRVLGDNVFTYHFQTMSDDPDSTLWAFLVYNRVPFVGFTGPPINLVGATD
jgi:hypothetical protein